MKFVAALLAAITARASSADDVWSKILLTDAAANNKAVCLDGSPGGFYYREGSGDNVDNWIVFAQGGGWCGGEDASGVEDCLARATSDLGSSTNWPDT